MSGPILIPEPITELIPIPELIPISEPIPISVPIPIPEPISIPELNPEPIPISISVTDSEPTIRNQLQKTSELAGIDSDEIFIFPITSMNTHVLCLIWFDGFHIDFFFFFFFFGSTTVVGQGLPVVL